MKKITMVVERTNTGYSAFAVKYPVFTVACDFTELRSNILEALNLYFEDEDKTVIEDDIKVSLDLQ